MPADDAAVTVVLRADLKAYEAALKSAVRSTERAAKAAEDVMSNVGKKGGAGKVIEANFQKSSRAIANDARVLQFQLNDIFSGIASGQGVRAVQVQLGQISQILSGTSLTGGARLLGSALLGMVNPINLAIVAFGVLAGVAASYFSNSIEDAKKATEELKKQADELENLAKKYGALFPELRRAADEHRRMADEAERNIAAQTALAAAYEKSNKTVADLSFNIDELRGILESTNRITDLSALSNAFNDLKKAIDSQNASVDDAEPLLKALDAIIASSTGKAKELAAALRREVVSALDELSRAAKSAKETLDSVSKGPGPGGNDFLTSPQRLKFSLLGGTPQEAALQRSQAAQLIKELEGFQQTAKFDVNAFRVGFGSDTFVDEMGKVQKVTKDTVVTLQQANQDLARRIPEFQATITKQIGPEYWKSFSEAQQAALTSIAYNFGSLPDSIVKAIKEGDNGKVAAAIAALPGTASRRGREAAPFGGVPRVATTVDPVKQIVADQKEVLDANKQFLISLQQQGVEAAQIQQQIAGIVGGAFSSFVQDLEAGKDAGDAFASVLQRLTSQLTDMALQLYVIKPLFGALFGGAGAGLTGGGLFEAGGSVSLSGRHDGRKFSPAVWAGAPRFAGGGMVGLRPGEMPIIAHRGEIVIPNARRMAGSPPQAGSPPGVVVNIANNNGSKVGVQRATDGRGQQSLSVTIDEQVARALAGDRSARAMAQQFGVGRRVERS